MDDFGMGYALGASENGNGNNGGCGGGMFGGDNGWLGLIVILALFNGGWGGLGGGMMGMGMGMMGGYPTEAILQRALDTQTIIGKLDGLNNGVCDGFYAQSNALNGLGMNMMQGFSQAELSRAQQQAATMQQLNTMAFQQQDCCCQTQRAIDGLGYNMATQFCAVQNTANNNARDIIQSTHNDTDRVIAKLDAMEMSRKDETIAALREQLQTAKFQASQTAQNGYIDAIGNSIVARLQPPSPVPSYEVPAPYPYCVPRGNGCGMCA